MKRFLVAFVALLAIQALGLNLSNHIQKVDLSQVVSKKIDYACGEYQDLKKKELCQELEIHSNR